MEAGVSSPFLVGCHCFANCGAAFSRLLPSALHSLQPAPSRVRAFTVDLHTCFKGDEHCHQTRFGLIGESCQGSLLPLSVGCHSAPMFGCNEAREFSFKTLCPEQNGQPFPSNDLRLTCACHSCLEFLLHRPPNKNAGIFAELVKVNIAVALRKPFLAQFWMCLLQQ